MPDQEFKNAGKLPPYIFAEINSLKSKARSNGEDIIDFGMGNPDQSTPNPVVDKLIETVKNPATHRYSQSAGLPKLRAAMRDWYIRRYEVDLDIDSEIVTCMGSKEGIAHLALATLSNDVVATEFPILSMIFLSEAPIDRSSAMTLAGMVCTAANSLTVKDRSTCASGRSSKMTMAEFLGGSLNAVMLWQMLWMLNTPHSTG